MKPTPRLLLIVSVLAFAGTFTAPVVHAAEKTAEQKAEAKKKKEAQNLRKYDRNANGRLDPDEEAAMKADQAKAKGKKKKKKRG